MKTDEYKSLYPDAPIMALSDKEKTTLNSGKHMKQEKYKKMFSDKIKGDKNPNHKSKTTESERKSRSPFSKEFIKYENVENVEEYISTFAKEAIKDRVSDTTLQYYINKGYSTVESEKLLKKRQATFSLEKCIEKHGDEYHANPLKFGENDTPHPFRKNITSKDIWMKDREKLKTAIDNGFEVLYIWDSEYSRVGEVKKSKIIIKCINFLKK